MSWAIGFDDQWERDIGYGVPAYCDHPGCDEKITRGLGYVCGSEPYGGEFGCGLYFCGKHLWLHRPEDTPYPVANCQRCIASQPPFPSKPDHPEWVHWKLTDVSWQFWREINAEKVKALQKQLEEQKWPGTLISLTSK